MVLSNDQENKVEELKQRPRKEKVWIGGAIVAGFILAAIFLFINRTTPTSNDAGTTTVEVDRDLEEDLKNELYVEAAIEDLKARTGIDDINILLVESRQWSDGCLGLGGPNQFCTQQIVEGYEVLLQADGQKYTYRTNETGTVVILEQ